ncbi:MAG TPA: DNA polymerase ligase N-terminal domain-containing protein [Pirellulaceae bacterium]|jgi:hypothetical protein
MSRFVVLLHQTPAGYARGTHLDLMLEKEGILLTWAIAELPTIDNSVLAERLADHRLTYLDYEGPILGGRGSVERIDRGEFGWLETTPRRYVALVTGEKLRGRLVLEQDDAEPQRWRVVLSD